jgi:hypothetical protein
VVRVHCKQCTNQSTLTPKLVKQESSVRSDIILDYVKSHLKANTLLQTLSNVSEVQHQPQVQKTNNNNKFPNQCEAILTLEQYTQGNIQSLTFLVIMFCIFHIYHVLCFHVANVVIHKLSVTTSHVSIIRASKRDVPNCDLFNIIV